MSHPGLTMPWPIVALLILAMVGTAGAQAPAPPAPVAPPAAGSRGPDIRLVGVIMGDGRPPLALIELPRTRQQGLYRVGDTVADARLEKILNDRAILRFQGQEVELRLAGTPAASAPTRSSAPVDPDTARRAELLARLRADPRDREAAEELRKLRADRGVRRMTPEELTRASAAADVTSAAAVDNGMLITQVAEGGALAGLGLRPGDIVRSVNRRPVGAQRSLAQALAEAAAERTELVRVEVVGAAGQRSMRHLRLAR